MLRTQFTVQPRFRNPAGEIVGAYRNSAGVHGFVLRDEVYVPIDFPGATATRAFGINSHGDIVGPMSRRMERLTVSWQARAAKASAED